MILQVIKMMLYFYGFVDSLQSIKTEVSKFFSILGFVRHMVSVAASQLCHRSAKAATDSM